jgi:transcriptional regulator GlxA family with amidase domain
MTVLPARLAAFVLFPDAQLLDATGPAEVLATATQLAPGPGYEIRFVSTSGGPVRLSAGCTVLTEPVDGLYGLALDLLLVVGGTEAAVSDAIRDRALRQALRRHAPNARRFGSVCSGAFILAACGLLDGRRVATHWSATERLALEYPDLIVDPDALFVSDGPLWTSGGVTTGIDMALAIVAADLGSDMAHATARQLVLSVRRPGHQSQFSPLLAAQRGFDGRFADLLAWMQANLVETLDAPTLAARANMSERTFQRRFTAAMGASPAVVVEKMRVEAARLMLTSGASLKTIARQTGFSSSTQLAAAFHRQLGMSPHAYRELHARPLSAPPL